MALNGKAKPVHLLVKRLTPIAVIGKIVHRGRRSSAPSVSSGSLLC